MKIDLLKNKYLFNLKIYLFFIVEILVKIHFYFNEFKLLI